MPEHIEVGKKSAKQIKWKCDGWEINWWKWVVSSTLFIWLDSHCSPSIGIRLSRSSISILFIFHTDAQEHRKSYLPVQWRKVCTLYTLELFRNVQSVIHEIVKLLKRENDWEQLPGSVNSHAIELVAIQCHIIPLADGNGTRICRKKIWHCFY